ncbi:MAG: hydrogenase small subunit [Thermodesulfovibrionales bacterium]|nr:hydrogenase small subunit [Thermodesulfovibrionales bacterium]
MGNREKISKQFLGAFEFQGIKRRDFLKFCGATAALLGLSESFIPKIAAAIEKASKRPPVVWLNFASDSGCTEALIKATYPNAADLILDILSVDYNETIMAAAGKQAEEILQNSKKAGGYILIVEGGIPTKKGHGMIAGKEMLDILKEMSEPAVAILAVGSCATFGGVPAAKPNPSQIIGVTEALNKVGVKKAVVNLDLCPVNVEYLVAVVVNYLLLGKLPELDSFGRPKMFYGQPIHDNCERRAHFDAGRFVETFGSNEEALGYCLYKMGCKGPMTYSACPKVMYNDRISWCVQAGGPCIGCAEHGWPDKFAGFYERLPDVKLPGIQATADKIGAVAGVATAVGIAAHAIATSASGRGKKEKDGGNK